MAGYGYGRQPQSVWGALGQGWQMGYLLGLKAKADRENQARTSASQLRAKEMEHGWKQQEREQSLLDDILKVGGNPAVDAYQSGEYGGSENLRQQMGERKGGLDLFQKILAEEGPQAATGFYGQLSQSNPGLYRPDPMPGESAVGEIGNRYGEPVPGQTMERPVFKGTKQMEYDRKADEAVRTRERERNQLSADAEANPELDPVLAKILNMAPEHIGTLRKAVPTKELLAIGRGVQGDKRVDQGQERVDIAKDLQALRELVEAGGTKKSAAGIANTQKRTEQIGKPRTNTARDQDVETYMRHFAGMSDDEIEMAIEDAPAGIQAKMRQAKQANFSARRNEILAGAGQSSPSPETPKDRFAVNPQTKQRLINRGDGQGWVPYAP